MSDHLPTSAFYESSDPAGDHDPLLAGVVSLRNPLAPVTNDRPVDGGGTPTHRVVWSGWFGPPDTSADGHVDVDPRTWSGPGRAALDAWLSQRLASSDAPLWLRPHARHILSDGPSCAAFARTHTAAVETRRVALLLDLDLMLTPLMQSRRMEHAERAIEMIGRTGAVAAIVLHPGEWSGPLGSLATSAAPDALRLTRVAVSP